MKFEPIEQLYTFSAVDRHGDAVEVGYVARTLEAASKMAERRGFTFVEFHSVAHLEGVQRTSIATHEALVDPWVGPGWLPFLWAINLVYKPTWSRSIVSVKFHQDFHEINRVSCPEVRINALPDGRCYLRVGSTAHIDRSQPGNKELIEQLGWKPQTARVERGYWRCLEPGWNTIHASHVALHGLSVTTGIRPTDWFRFSGAAFTRTNGMNLFASEKLGHDVFYRTPHDTDEYQRLVRMAKRSGFDAVARQMVSITQPRRS
jgi:hypothetical protein